MLWVAKQQLLTCARELSAEAKMSRFEGGDSCGGNSRRVREAGSTKGCAKASNKGFSMEAAESAATASAKAADPGDTHRITTGAKCIKVRHAVES